MFIDAHNHLQDPRFKGFRDQIVDDMKAAGIVSCLVNGTSESDWDEVKALAQRFPDFVRPAYGLHPWRVAERSSDWVSRLRSLLLDDPQASIGECGLDRWIRNPHFPAQLTVFRSQLELARELDRPVTVHCLKAWAPLMELLREMPTHPRILLHSFNGSLEIARELATMGAYFSFSGYFLHERKKSQLEIFRQLPLERVLVETDAPDMLPPDSVIHFSLGKRNHPANLAGISKRLLEETQLTHQQLIKNTQAFFEFS
ncbi:MAG: TatD family hydrolase [Akkermansiaceae bacterium]